MRFDRTLALPMSAMTGPGSMSTNVIAAETVKPSSTLVPIVAPAPMARAPCLGASHFFTSVASKSGAAPVSIPLEPVGYLYHSHQVF